MDAAIHRRKLIGMLGVISAWIAAAPMAATAARSPISPATGHAPAVNPAADQSLSYSGTETDRHSAKFLYGGHDILRCRDGRLAERVVLYTCSNDSAFARKTVRYVDPFAPAFLLEVALNGMREGVRKVGPWPPIRGLVAHTGFDEFAPNLSSCISWCRAARGYWFQSTASAQ